MGFSPPVAWETQCLPPHSRDLATVLVWTDVRQGKTRAAWMLCWEWGPGKRRGLQTLVSDFPPIQLKTSKVVYHLGKGSFYF